MMGNTSNEERVGDYSIDFEKLVKNIVRSLYPKKDMFIRGLWQNAHDLIKRYIADPMHVGRIDIRESFFCLFDFRRENPCGTILD